MVVKNDPMLANYENIFITSIPVELMRHNHIDFTIKFRVDEYSPWQWVEDQFGTCNGEILLQKPLESPMNLDPYLHLGRDWEVEQLYVDGKSATFHLQSRTSLPPATEGDAKREQLVLGKVPGQLRFMALVRLLEPWLGPRHGNAEFSVEEDAIMCCFLNEAGQHLTLLPMNGIGDVQTLIRSDEEYNVVVVARNDGPESCTFRVIAAVASTIEESISAAVDAARDFVTNSSEARQTASHITKVINGDLENLRSSPVEDWCDGLAYCTYNSLGMHLDISKILKGLESLSRAGVTVSSMIIDDKWQKINDQENPDLWQCAWEDFEADKKCFPNGLKSAITTIREKHPVLKDIAIWHALLGYWGGMSPSGHISQKYRMIQDKALLQGHVPAVIHTVHPDDVYRMYDDFYSFLSSCGITSVKTDVQFMIDQFQSTKIRGSVPTAYQSAWTTAHLRHFQGKAISCMSMIPQILFHSFLPTNNPVCVMRNSDDFFPEIRSSHPRHLFLNAHNALFTQNLNVLPDWDMFQTSHPYSRFHAAARCISGGPVYITDSPNEHDIELIHEMSAPDQHGRTIILRPTNVARTISAYDAYSEGHLLKIGTTTGEGRHQASILGVFNISEHEKTFMLNVNEILSTASELPAGKALILCYRNSLTFPPVDLAQSYTSPLVIHGTLNSCESDIFSAHPIHEVALMDSLVSVAVLGLLGKMTGAAAVLSVCSTVVDDLIRLDIGLKALGRLGVWMAESRAGSQRVSPSEMTAVVQGTAIPKRYLLITSDANGYQVDIDLLTAWRDLGLQGSDSKEISVTLWI